MESSDEDEEEAACSWRDADDSFRKIIQFMERNESYSANELLHFRSHYDDFQNRRRVAVKQSDIRNFFKKDKHARAADISIVSSYSFVGFQDSDSSISAVSTPASTPVKSGSPRSLPASPIRPVRLPASLSAQADNPDESESDVDDVVMMSADDECSSTDIH